MTSTNPFKRPSPLKLAWDDNPEPEKGDMEPDPRSIIDTDLREHDAYMWESHNCKEGWMEFTGELLDIEA
jgi:hypothetical protein